MIMNPLFFLVVGVFFLIYAGLNYYIGLRGWQALFSHQPFVNHYAYWLVFWLIALSYLAGRIGEKYYPGWLSHWLTLVGAYWLGAMFYFVLILAGIDLIRLLDRLFRFLPGWARVAGIAPAVGLCVFLLVSGLLLFGAWNARHPKVQRYHLALPKPAGNLTQLHAVMVSDVHLGTIVKNGQLVKMVDMVNSLKPDIVLFAGDVIDESVEPFVEQQMADSFRRLQSRYGVYAVLGNHEYIGGHAEEVVQYLREAGVQVLRDQYVKVAGSFYLAGRDDSSRERFGAGKRKDLAALLSGVDRRAPLILLDHQPTDLENAQIQGVDLQLSGHTHLGQMFPNQLITGRMYEDDWGLLRKGNLQVIVSSGFGTWGPPIRLGNSPEVVDIVLDFVH